MFFKVFARSYLLGNNFIHISIQKAGVLVFLWCLKHVSMICARVHDAKNSRINLHSTRLNISNSYGSALHSMIQLIIEFNVLQGLGDFVRMYLIRPR